MTGHRQKVQECLPILRSVRLRDGRQVVIGLRQAPIESGKWVVFLPGSSPQLHRAEEEDIQRLLGRDSDHTHFLVINKAGLKISRGVNKRVFEKSFQRAQRVDDAIEVIRKIIPRGDEICLVGYSEGAYIAPEIAVRLPSVKALVLLAGGTRGWLAEELRKMKPKELLSMADRLVEIYAQKNPSKKWRGVSHSTWLSYDNNQTLHALEQLDIPVFSIYGNKDELVDTNAVAQDFKWLKRLKPSLVKHKSLDGFGHDFNDKWDLVYAYAHKFMRANFLRS